jgi:hypothetical protein
MTAKPEDAGGRSTRARAQAVAGPLDPQFRPLNSSPFLELRGAELKFEHYGLSTSKGSAMVWRAVLHFRLPPTHLAKMDGRQTSRF